MPYRNIFVANSAKLSCKNNQLVVGNYDSYTFPIEDVRCILIESQSVSVTSYLVSQLANKGVCVIFCDSKHLPASVLLPINGFCRQEKRLLLQFNQSKPNLKRLWQSIVISKIKNQAKCLELCGKGEAKQLYDISKSVASGDTTNREAYAAALYFKALFGKKFCRNDENSVNAALNYGYAIIRTYISRTLAVYGFEPSLGIHHSNDYNNFNLADDLIEPFRPVIDLFVYNNVFSQNEEFNSVHKAELLRLLNAVILSGKERHSVAFAIERLIQSLVSSYEDGSVLTLPTLLKTDYFDYD